MEAGLETAAATGEPVALNATTMCEAFQLTSAARAEQVALRTMQDGITITFAEYADKVRRLAAGFHALGVRRGDTVAFMLHNRPEFHPLDAAVMHLGGIPFSVYNTSSPEQIAYLLSDAAPRVFVVEAGFLDDRPGCDRAPARGGAHGAVGRVRSRRDPS